MEKINPVVAAKVAMEMARAQEKVAALESRQRTAAVNTGGSWRGVNLGKLLTEARWQAESWVKIHGAMGDLGDAAQGAARSLAALIESMGSPLAYRVYSEKERREVLVCTREDCALPERWNHQVRHPVAPEGIGAGWQCWVCGAEITQ